METMADSAHLRGSRYWVSGHPELASQWDRDRNGTLTPDTVTAGSGRMIWWRCPRGEDHVWRAKPNNRSRGSGCPFCANKKVCSTNNLAFCFPHIASEWHLTKNGRTGPTEVLSASSRVCWWQCAAHPGHAWRASVRDRTRDQTSCPYCSHKRVSPECSLSYLHPSVAAEWHPTRNGALSPSDVSPASRRHVWWQCGSKPEHAWRASVANRVLRMSGCPHCARRGLRACA